MIELKFFDHVDDSLLDFAVIAARHQGKWVFCKHRERDTYECPGGHREPGEDILRTAERELWEETGAVRYELKELGVYSVVSDGVETYGMLYFAEIIEFGPLPPLEIERIEFFDVMPDRWTYPQIQPKLIELTAGRCLRAGPLKASQRDVSDKDHGDVAGQAADNI